MVGGWAARLPRPGPTCSSFVTWEGWGRSSQREGGGGKEQKGGTNSRPGLHRTVRGGDARAHLEPDLLIDKHWTIAEGDGIAEAGLPLDSLVAEVHEDLGALGVWVEEQRRGWEPPAGQHRGAVLLLVVASVRCDGQGAPDGVCKGIGHSVRELKRSKSPASPGEN